MKRRELVKLLALSSGPSMYTQCLCCFSWGQAGHQGIYMHSLSLFSQQPYDFYPILQRRKQTHREGKRFALGHTAERI